MAKSDFEENKVIKNQNTFSWSGRRYGRVDRILLMDFSVEFL